MMNDESYTTDDAPIKVFSPLAVIIGFNESMLLLEMSDWTKQEPNVRTDDGNSWCRISYEGMQKRFPFWSVPTVRRTVSSLLNKNLIFSKTLNKASQDRTLSYRVNYPEVLRLLGGEKLPYFF